MGQYCGACRYYSRRLHFKKYCKRDYSKWSVISTYTNQFNKNQLFHHSYSCTCHQSTWCWSMGLIFINHCSCLQRSSEQNSREWTMGLGRTKRCSMFVSTFKSWSRIFINGFLWSNANVIESWSNIRCDRMATTNGTTNESFSNNGIKSKMLIVSHFKKEIIIPKNLEKLTQKRQNSLYICRVRVCVYCHNFIVCSSPLLFVFNCWLWQ